MITFKIESLQELEFGSDIVLMEAGHHIFEKTQFKVKIPVFFAVFATGKMGEIDFDAKELFDEETITLFSEIQQIVSSCAYLGERLSDQLVSTNLAFKESTIVDDIIQEIELEKNRVIETMDFEMNRQLFSKMIKCKRYPWMEELNVNYDIKSLTKTLFEFIKDRNKLTHGSLFYWTEKSQIVLRYKDGKNSKFAIINPDILNSYIQCFRDVNDFLIEVFNNLNVQNQ